MRPVIRIDPVLPCPPYPFVLPDSMRARTVAIDAGTAAAAEYNNGAAFTATIEWVVERLLTYVGHYLDRAANTYLAKEELRGKLTPIYQASYDSLVYNFGEYCSYCEIPRRPERRLDIEHRAAKSQFPFLFVLWGNFLLACSQCNTTKWSSPYRSTVAGWIPPPHTEERLLQALYQAYRWPDLYPDTYQAINQRLTINTGTRREIVLDMALAASRRNTLVASFDNKVHATITRTDGSSSSYDDRIVLHCISTPLAPMIELMRLVGIDNQTDHRAYNRTETWFKVLMNYNFIFSAVESVPPLDKNAAFQALWEQYIIGSAVSLGFASAITLALMQQALPPGVTDIGGFASLGQKFLVNAADWFRGTNMHQMP